MLRFDFYWSPEGRRLCTIKADDLSAAKAQFRRDFSEHARFMGEVYIVQVLPVVTAGLGLELPW